MVNINVNKPSDDRNVSSDSRTKPDHNPRNDDFNKAITRKDSRSPEQEAAALQSKEKKTSLFSLSNAKTPPKPAQTQRSTSSKAPQQSSSSAKNQPTKEKKAVGDEGNKAVVGEKEEEEVNPEELAEHSGPAEPKAKLPKDQESLSAFVKSSKKCDEGESLGDSLSSKKDKAKTEGSRSSTSAEPEKGMGAVGPQNQSVNFFMGKSQEVKEPATASSIMKELATQIVDRIQVMRKDDLTSTQITLRSPPILEGATITLVTSENTPNQFTISFASLSAEGKNFLDNALKEDSLTKNLEEKGLTVHILPPTTDPEPLITQETYKPDQRDGQEKEQQRQRQQQQQEGEEE